MVSWGDFSPINEVMGPNHSLFGKANRKGVMINPTDTWEWGNFHRSWKQVVYITLGGGNSNILFLCSPRFGWGRFPNLTFFHIFPDGLVKNHQLKELRPTFGPTLVVDVCHRGSRD